MNKTAAVAGLPLVLALLGSTGLTTSQPPGQRVRLAYHTAFRLPSTTISAEDQALAEENCPFGLPEKDPAWQYGPTTLVARRGYALEHSAVDKIPLWVCEHIEPNEITGTADRRDPFAPDPKLTKGLRAELADYKGSGYDRGHMAPAADQKSYQNRNDETFFLSNMAPQVGAGFNRGIWADLEDRIRGWVQHSAVTSAWVVTGPMFYAPKEEDAATATGIIEHPVIGKDAVSVPTHFYKIAVGQTSDGRWKAAAFVLENRPYKVTEKLEICLKAIDWIEERTGLNFMPRLDPAMEEQLERKPGSMFE